jgi:anti-sigma regulatory factor (Ser/Thr protein kinase)
MAGWAERFARWWRKPQKAVPTGVVWHLRVERDRAAISKLNGRLEQQLHPSVPEPALRALQVALDELLTNVVMHADGASGPIDLRLARTVGTLDATVSYLADPFDPTAWKADAPPKTIESAKVGGLGLPLVRALMDDFRHEYADGRNVLHLKKRC